MRIRSYVTADNKIDGATIVVLDIDALKRASEQLKQSRDYADAIVEAVWEPLLVLDENLRIKRANSAFYRTFRVSRDEVEDRFLSQVGSGQWSTTELQALLKDILPKNARFHNFEFEAEFPDVGRRSMLLNAHRIYWEGSRTQMILLAFEDVTDREREVEQEKLLVQEQAARAEAETANRLKDEFLAMLAHELRNPLAPIRNGLQILKLCHATEGPVGKVSEIMERQVRHMAKLLDDLLDVSRITRGTIHLSKEPVDLTVVVARAVESSAPGIESRGHSLHVKVSPEPVLLQADPLRLEQVVCNLLNNASKFTKPQGQIWLTAEPEGREAVVKVKDSGVGIPPEMLERVFDLFTQGERSLDRSEGGLGIGLTLARSLVQLHGGSIKAYSPERGQGSEFVMRFPLWEGPLPERPGEKEKTVDSSLRKMRFLVVDDNRDVADSMAMELRLGGHEVRTAYDGPGAIATAITFLPEVVLLDLGLPRMDGYQVALSLREKAELDATTLIAVTGYGTEEDRRRSREAGFDYHLVKPVDPQELHEILSATARPTSP
jgi:two-component system CheB/CheR fusion protein